jgi:hypothetical protein
MQMLSLLCSLKEPQPHEDCGSIEIKFLEVLQYRNQTNTSALLHAYFCIAATFILR